MFQNQWPEQGISGDDHTTKKAKNPSEGNSSKYRIHSIVSFSFESHSYGNAPLIDSTAKPCILFF